MYGFVVSAVGEKIFFPPWAAEWQINRSLSKLLGEFDQCGSQEDESRILLARSQGENVLQLPPFSACQGAIVEAAFHDFDCIFDGRNEETLDLRIVVDGCEQGCQVELLLPVFSSKVMKVIMQIVTEKRELVSNPFWKHLATIVIEWQVRDEHLDPMQMSSQFIIMEFLKH